MSSHRLVQGHRGTERGDNLVASLLERLVTDAGDADQHLGQHAGGKGALSAIGAMLADGGGGGLVEGVLRIE